ncbi:MAG: PIG-L deacetylase family protein [Chloroflexota bacterium]|nr:PIG-L deacetylase family protein [Chloroflexota bacterium]
MTTSNRVLVVLAHPDDPEFYCGGTIARWAASGREITYCLLTRGDKGSDDDSLSTEELAEIREVEQRAAAKALGVHEVMFLKELDGYVLPTLDLRRDIVRVIRQVKPQVVITCDPTNFFPSNTYINHADHRAAGQATLDAVYPAARSALYFPALSKEEGLQPHKVREVYIAGPQHPNITVDITEFFNQMVDALGEHRSQIKDINALEERMRERMLDPESPPDDPRYIEKFRRIEFRQ